MHKLLTALIIYVSVQAILGIIFIEYAFYRTKRFRDGNEARDCLYPGYRRYDAYKWTRWQFYPGAIFMMPTRAILLVVDAVLLVIIIKILCIGHNFKTGPMKKGCRKSFIKFFSGITCQIYLLLAGMTSSKQKIDVDYSYYLGPHYKNQ